MGYLPDRSLDFAPHMEKRPVDLGTRDGTVVFAILLLGIFAISASVLVVILVVTSGLRVAH
jgi:hypothetical protein